MRWWWFGPQVTDEELGRELQAMKDAGIGGVEVQPVYPVALDDAANGLKTEPFLSDAFLAHLKFAADRAAALGLRFDLTLGSGWPYGGPTVSIDHAAGRLRIERVPIPPQASRVALPHVGAGESFIAGEIVAPGAWTRLDPSGTPFDADRTVARRRRRPASARARRLHLEPHRPDGEARGRRRRGLRPRPLRRGRHQRLSLERRRAALERLRPHEAVRDLLRQPRGLRLGLDVELPCRVRAAPRLRHQASPAGAGVRRQGRRPPTSGTTGARRSPSSWTSTSSRRSNSGPPRVARSSADKSTARRRRPRRARCWSICLKAKARPGAS